MISYLSMVSANFKMTVRNRQSLFWLFVFPILMMTLLGIVFGGISNQGASIAVVSKEKSQVADSIYKSFKEIDSFTVEKQSEGRALKELKNGDLDAVIVMKKGFASELEQNSREFNQGEISGSEPSPPKPAKIELFFDPSSTFTSQAVRGAVTNVIAEINKKMSNTPDLIAVESQSVRSADLRYIDFLVPGIIALTLMNSALFGLGGTVVNYRERGILRRLKVTPQPLSGFIAAQITNQLVFSILRAALLIIVAQALFGVAVLGDYISLIIVVIVGSLTFITIAFSIASFSRTRETNDTLSNIVSMPMMFLGGVFFPVDSAPAWIQPLIRIMPLKYLGDAMRDVMIKGEGLTNSNVMFDMYILLGVTLVFFLISIRLWKWE